MSRIAVGGFQHETNSFVAHLADFAYFAAHRDRPPLVRGPELIAALTGGGYAMSGFLAATAARHDIVPLAWASGGAGGVVTADAFERIKSYIDAGDCYQVNLAQRFSAQAEGNPWMAYRQLRQFSPAPSRRAQWKNG